jgi:acetoin utilization deacetylase AcuC-like enzyme
LQRDDDDDENSSSSIEARLTHLTFLTRCPISQRLFVLSYRTINVSLSLLMLIINCSTRFFFLFYTPLHHARLHFFYVEGK